MSRLVYHPRFPFFLCQIKKTCTTPFCTNPCIIPTFFRSNLENLCHPFCTTLCTSPNVFRSNLENLYRPFCTNFVPQGCNYKHCGSSSAGWAGSARKNRAMDRTMAWAMGKCGGETALQAIVWGLKGIDYANKRKPHKFEDKRGICLQIIARIDDYLYVFDRD